MSNTTGYESRFTGQEVDNRLTEVSNKLGKSDVINNLTSENTDKPLSAKMGKNLQDQINNLRTIGRYLSGWNCATGLPTTTAPTSPYYYQAGDYYIISNIATGSGANYKPNGSFYTEGIASTTVETGTIKINDYYRYDGTVWTIEVNPQIKVSFASIYGNPMDNSELATLFNLKANSADLATVATSGLYNDLINKPEIDQTYNSSSANAQSGTAVAGAISNKVTKTNTINQVYVTNNSGITTYIGYGEIPTGGTIVQRKSADGHITVPSNPNANTDATAKIYVDDGLSAKENINNKVSSWQTVTDTTHYPCEKLVKDNLDLKVDKATPSSEGTYSYTVTRSGAVYSNGTKKISENTDPNSIVSRDTIGQVKVILQTGSGSEATTVSGYATPKDYVDDGLNRKQDILQTQTAYAAVGSADKINKITTNTLGQVTEITQSNIQIVEGQVTNLITDLDDIRAIAEGKAATYVINSQSDITGTKDENENYTNVTAITGVEISKLKLGDNILIKQLDVPDYWVSQLNKTDGITTSVSLNKLEIKVRLDAYVNDADNGLQLVAGTNGKKVQHINSVTAVTTAGFNKHTYDAQGHITGSTPVVKSDISDLGVLESSQLKTVNGESLIKTSLSSLSDLVIGRWYHVHVPAHTTNAGSDGVAYRISFSEYKNITTGETTGTSLLSSRSFGRVANIILGNKYRIEFKPGTNLQAYALYNANSDFDVDIKYSGYDGDTEHIINYLLPYIYSYDVEVQSVLAAMGSTTKPIYVSSAGTISACSDYAGGTAVTLNATNKSGMDTSFYAPVTSGNSGQILYSNGSNSAPDWTNTSDLTVGNATIAEYYLNGSSQSTKTIKDALADKQNNLNSNQLAAVNSGITDTLVGKITANESAISAHVGNQSNPHYVTKAQVGLSNVGNYKAVSTVSDQSLTDAEKLNARTNIGAGTSSFSGSYNDLSDKPTNLVTTDTNQYIAGTKTFTGLFRAYDEPSSGEYICEISGKKLEFIDRADSGSLNINNLGISIKDSILSDSNTTYSRGNIVVGSAKLTLPTTTGTLALQSEIPEEYVLPVATSGALGGIKIGYILNNKNYPVQLSEDKAYVNVPWQNTEYDVVTQTSNGLMSSSDKIKLNKITFTDVEVG